MGRYPQNTHSLYFAIYVCTFRVVIIRTSDFRVLQEIDSIPKTSNLMFSPKGSILATWEAYTGWYFMYMYLLYSTLLGLVPFYKCTENWMSFIKHLAFFKWTFTCTLHTQPSLLASISHFTLSNYVWPYVTKWAMSWENLSYHMQTKKSQISLRIPAAYTWYCVCVLCVCVNWV